MMIDPLFFPGVILILFAAIFIAEFRRHEKSGGRYWPGRFLLSLAFISGIPFLLMLLYVLCFGDRVIPQPVDARTEEIAMMRDIYLSGAICLVLPCFLYLIARKLIK